MRERCDFHRSTIAIGNAFIDYTVFIPLSQHRSVIAATHAHHSRNWKLNLTKFTGRSIQQRHNMRLSDMQTFDKLVEFLDAASHDHVQQFPVAFVNVVGVFDASKLRISQTTSRYDGVDQIVVRVEMCHQLPVVTQYFRSPTGLQRPGVAVFDQTF
jgi:hypothetical protein